nr:hypothetical protein [Tanacetum cinerariifolium]
MKNDKVIAPGMFRIIPFKLFREEKHVPNKVIVDITAKTRRQQPKSNTKNDRVPSASKSSCKKNKEVEVEEHHRNLLLSKNKKHKSSECNNVKLATQNVKSKVVCDMCKQCLISVNHDVCLLNYVNDMNSHGKKQKANVSIKENQKKQKPKVKKPKKVGSIERLTSPKPGKPRPFLRWSPTGRLFDLKGKIIASSESESQSDCSKGANALLLTLWNLQSNGFQILLFRWQVIQICLWCVDSGCSKHMTENLKLLINFVWKFLGTVRFGNDHVAAIMGFGDLQRGNILITKEIAQQTFTPSTSMKWPLHPQFASWLVLLPPSHGYGINVYPNFDTINDLAKNNLVTGLLKFKYHKGHLCPSCEQGKSKRASHPPKPIPNSRQRLHLLHMDLCGPMRIASINGKRNRTLVEATRTMLIFSHAPLFLWAEAIATACFTQNRSIIHRRFNKTPYELINSRKPDISFLYVFRALCYPKNDHDDIGKLGAKGDIGFFIGYSTNSCAYRVYNRRTKKIMETMNVTFDELSVMAFEQSSSKLGLQSMTSGQISSGLDLTYAPSTITSQQPTECELDLLFEAMYDDYIGGHPSATSRTVSAAQATSIVDTAPTPTNSSSQATKFPISSQDVDGLKTQQQHAQ